MSLRSRARALQKATGLSYQQALERIRSLGRAPAELAKKTGWPLKDCDLYLIGRGKPAALGLPHPSARALSEVCERLRAETSARAVCIIDARGNWIAMAGFAALMLLALPRTVRMGGGELESVALDAQHGIHVLSSALETGARLFVLFEEARLVGVVRLRAQKAVADINRILTEPIAFRPPDGGDSGSGAPGQISAFDGLFDRPKPRERRGWD